jgi:hypothetical protein
MDVSLTLTMNSAIALLNGLKAAMDRLKPQVQNDHASSQHVCADPGIHWQAISPNP